MVQIRRHWDMDLESTEPILIPILMVILIIRGLLGRMTLMYNLSTTNNSIR